MKKILVVIALAALVAAAALIGQGFTYVGAKKCAMCHRSEAQGRQYVIWQGTKHATSADALTSAKAADAAKSMGVDKPAEDPRCLKCHVPLAEKAPAIKAEGVTCEVCHGPGSGYQKLNIMRDKAAAVQNGLVLYGSPDAIKAQCLTCHEDAHGIKFDFATYWDKIKHPVPAK
ncbi:MAG TPA: multiheme c-type cytochrome [Candidatus Bathyarchaeia archaeon]|nr:multiheme c-type cytochrome [Candidatus Bathyarchaeia archaeon]